MAKVKWGIIGASGWADHTFGPAIARARGAELVAALSSHKQRAHDFAKRHGCARAYGALSRFAADPDIDAVWVASSTHLHFRHTLACLKAGKHVLCEKPMALSVAQCEAMIAAAQKSGRLLSTGFQMRHLAQHAEAARLVSRGAIGKVALARARFFFPYPKPPAPWRQSKRQSGGWAIGDLGVHLLDLLRSCLGEALAVEATLTSPKFGFETEDLAVLHLQYRNGAVGVVECSTGVADAAPCLEIYGTQGSIAGALFGELALTDAKGRKRVLKTDPRNPYVTQVEDFCRALAGAKLRVSARDGLEAVRLLAAARKSASSGRVCPVKVGGL